MKANSSISSQQTAVLTEPSPPHSMVSALPLAGSLIGTGAVVSLFSLPDPASLSWPRLLAFTLYYLGTTACVHGTVVWSICRALRPHFRLPSRLLILELWTCAGSLALFALLEKEHSIWAAAAVMPFTVGSTVQFLHSRMEGQHGIGYELLQPGRHREIFSIAKDQPAWQSLLPAAIIAISAQAGLGALLARHVWIAGFLFSISATVLVCRYPSKHASADPRHPRPGLLRFSAIYTLLLMALAAIALTPSLRENQVATGLVPLSKRKHSAPSGNPPPTPGHQSANGYSGIILLSPPKPHPFIAPTAKTNPLLQPGPLAQPLIIPFDGAYWYFQIPDTHPGPNAPRKHGDPLTANIHSTDRIPILMEAHQPLNASISIDCCRTLQVNLVNADNQEGTIEVEILLRDTAARSRSELSLGSVVIPSSQARSISVRRPPVHESLTFSFPSSASGRQFNEITVLIRPDWNRALAGSKASIQSFTLLP